MSLTSSIIANFQITPVIEFDGDGTIKQIARVVEVDASSGNVIITLGVITNNTIKYFPMIIKRIDANASFTVTINGTSSNYEDEGIVLLQEEGTTVYANNALFWRSDR